MPVDAETGPSSYLSWPELACKDGTAYPEVWRGTRALELALVFERIRTACGDKPLTILSAFRTPTHNRRVGGARNSQHVQGRALDLRPPTGLSVQQFHDRILALARDGLITIGGLGYYPAHRFVHVDIRPSVRLVRWTGAGAKDSAGT